jgi:hypothetical protein
VFDWSGKTHIQATQDSWLREFDSHFRHRRHRNVAWSRNYLLIAGVSQTEREVSHVRKSFTASGVQFRRLGGRFCRGLGSGGVLPATTSAAPIPSAASSTRGAPAAATAAGEPRAFEWRLGRRIRRLNLAVGQVRGACVCYPEGARNGHCQAVVI